MIDLHTHILPGLDDGVADAVGCVALAEAMVADGVTIAVGTPHVRDDYPTTPVEMEGALAVARSAIEAAGLSLKVVGGGELALDRMRELPADDVERFAYGRSRVVLLESPVYGWPFDLGMTIADLRRRGYVPVLAHPERNVEVREHPERLRDFVADGALVQVTASSVDGRFGKETARLCRRLAELELVHLIASDAHGAGVREAGMSRAAEAMGEELGRWLTQDVPAALLAGEPLPERPSGKRRGLFRR